MKGKAPQTFFLPTSQVSSYSSFNSEPFSSFHRANSLRDSIYQKIISLRPEWGKCLWKLRWRRLLFKFSTSCLGICCRVVGRKKKVGNVMFELNEKNVSGKSRCYPVTLGTGWRLAFCVIINFLITFDGFLARSVNFRSELLWALSPRQCGISRKLKSLSIQCF